MATVKPAHVAALKAAAGTSVANVQPVVHAIISDGYQDGVDTAADQGADTAPPSSGLVEKIAAAGAVITAIAAGFSPDTDPADVAQNIAHDAANTGTMDSYSASGITSYNFVADSDTPCPECDEQEQNNPHDVGGDDPYPALHPGCECTVEPVHEGQRTMTLPTRKPRARTQTPVLPYTRELRFQTTDAEVRDNVDGDGWTLDVGFAPFNSEARINDGVGKHGYFIETFTPHTFDSTDFSSCVAIEGHNRAARPFGSVAAGTMRIYKDGNRGMRYSVPLDPRSPDHQSIRVCAQRGEYQASLAMMIPEGGDTWSVRSDGVEARTVNVVSEVVEVSLVSHPAYKQTNATMRSQAPDTRRRLRELHSIMQAELREGKTLSAKTSAAITAALGHVTQAGDHLSSVLQPNVGGPDGSMTPSGYLTGAGYPVDNNASPSRGDAAAAAAAFAADRFAIDRRRIARIKARRWEETIEAADVFEDDRVAIASLYERIAAASAPKYRDRYTETHSPTTQPQGASQS